MKTGRFSRRESRLSATVGARLTCTCGAGIIMIRSFADRETEKIYNQMYSRVLPRSIQKTALRKLIMMNAASGLSDLLVPPGNHLEQLKGNRKGQYSIRINDQYRICFKEKQGDFYQVEITDYH